MKTYFQLSISLLFLGVFTDIYTLPFAIEYPSDGISKPVKRVKLQIEEVQSNNSGTVSANQLKFIGNNVGKVVASSIMGNFGGIFESGLNLLNSNNRLNSILGNMFGLKGPVAQAPNGTVPNRLYSERNRGQVTTLATTSITTDSPSEENEEDSETETEDEDTDDSAKAKKL